MAQTLDEFVEEVKTGIDAFAVEYRKKAKTEGEYYPLEFGDDNDGFGQSLVGQGHHRLGCGERASHRTSYQAGNPRENTAKRHKHFPFIRQVWKEAPRSQVFLTTCAP